MLSCNRFCRSTAFLALELSDDAVALLRELGHIGVLVAGDFSDNGLIAGVQRTKDRTRPVCRRDC